MVLVTGDIHGNPYKVVDICEKHKLSCDDVIVLLGDVGANYYLRKRDRHMKEVLAHVKPTILCIHGNHEARPQTVPGYEEIVWNGGIVYYQPEFSNILFAKDGEIFQLGDKRCLAIGGAYSVDKWYRLRMDWQWFPDEQPSEETKARVEQALAEVDWKIDVILSHTCPAKYTPIECYLSGIDQSTVDKSTEEWLDTIENSTDYEAWYCGHWHINKRIDKLHFLFDGVEELV